MAKKKAKSSIFSTIRNSLGAPSYGRREFKRDVNKLIKQGLYNPSVPVNELQPGRYVNSLLKKFKDVLGGTAQAIQVNPGEISKYREQGFRTRNGRAIVEVPKGAKAKRVRSDNGVPRFDVIQRTPQGTRRTTRELVPYVDLEARIMREVNSQRELRKGEYYGFRFYGNNSARYFKEKQTLLNYFLAYQSVDLANRAGSAEDQQEIYQNFEVTIFSDVKAYGEEYNKRFKERQQNYNRAAQARYRERLKERYAAMDEIEKREYRENKYKDRENRAAREKARRAQLKHDDPAAYAKMLEANAARVKASRAKKK
jgi:hypothetical protein